MARQVKCAYCENKVDKEEAHVYKKKNYHEKCFQIWEQEKIDYENLKTYICELHRLDFPTGVMLKQIKNYKEENLYKYRGMELALRYFYETLDNKVRQGDGIGIIPYVYEDAKLHYIKQQNIKKSIQDENNHKSKEIVVHIQPSQKRVNKQIDIASI